MFKSDEIVAFKESLTPRPVQDIAVSDAEIHALCAEVNAVLARSEYTLRASRSAIREIIHGWRKSPHSHPDAQSAWKALQSQLLH